jgi:8-oxo-dGTP pyrophosphatase MutT (NUDIX family)
VKAPPSQPAPARVLAIRQIAALPYRTDTPDGGVRVLLITSRSTRRWVIPKGNIGGGMAPHLAAAQEAEEEAGVRGSICPTPLGSYRYRKRRGSGASLMIDVDVFPLAVTDELEGWKEQAERERRWFTLAEAADAVDEFDLRDLMRSFSASEFKAAARRGLLAHRAKVTSMFVWFQRLLPRTGNFFEMFEAHAATVNAGADAMCRLLSGSSAAAEHVREVV